MTRKENIAVILLFLGLIYGSAALSLFKGDRDFSEKENRVLAQMPEVNREDVISGKFSKDYETYLADQFFGRDTWIGVKTTAERLEGKQEINDIYFAKDGYLIEKHTGVFDTDTAQNNISYLADFLRSWQKEYGSEHVKAIIVPNAVEILKEKLPPFAVDKDEQIYLAKIEAALPEDSFVDAAEVLMQHKDEQLYYKTDHHWKTGAARHVYEAWAEEAGISILPLTEYEEEILTEDFYGTIDAKVNVKRPADIIETYVPMQEVPYTLTYNHKEEKTSLYDRSCLDGRDKYAVFFGGNQPLIEARTEAGTGRRLLVIKDSYANCFLPFALQDFDAADIIDLRYYNEEFREKLENKEYTDILVLYNAAGFAQDASAAKLALATRQEET